MKSLFFVLIFFVCSAVNAEVVSNDTYSTAYSDYSYDTNDYESAYYYEDTFRDRTFVTINGSDIVVMGSVLVGFIFGFVCGRIRR